MEWLNHLLNGLSQGANYALIAVGYTMVYGIIKLINFAHGEFYMLGAYAGFFLLVNALGVNEVGGAPGLHILILTLLVASLASGVIAVIVERLCYKPLRGAGRIVALLAALGVSMFLQNYMQQGASPAARKFPPTIEVQRYPKFELNFESLVPGATAERDTALAYYVRDDVGRLQLRQYMLCTKGDAFEADKLAEARTIAATSASPAKVYGYPALTVNSKQFALFITLGLVALGLFWIVQHTRFGRAMRAVSHDFEAARLMGINVDRVITGTFFIGAFVAGLGGVLTGGMYFERIDPLMGSSMGLKAFIAAVLGGIGSIPGAILGALLLGVSEKLVEASDFSGARDGVAFAILIGILLVRPQGLLGRFEGEKV